MWRRRSCESRSVALCLEELEREEGAPGRKALERRLERLRPRAIRDERREEAEPFENGAAQPGRLEGAEDRPPPHLHDAFVALPRHVRHREDLYVVERVVRVRLEENGATSRRQQLADRAEEEIEPVPVVAHEE